MQRFAWQSARSVAEAATLGRAHRRRGDAGRSGAARRAGLRGAEGRRHRFARPDEGRLAVPGRVVNLREIAGLDGIAEDGDGMRIGALVTLEQLAAHPMLRQRYTALGGRRWQFGQPANPPRGDARRQPAATAALLVFPLRGASLRAQRRRPLLRLRRREPIPRGVRPDRLRDRASVHRRRPRWPRSMRASSW